MDIIQQLKAFPSVDNPIVLTIGNFDGVHLGHRSVINEVLRHAKLVNGLAVVLTFSNHPSSILKPDQSTRTLCTSEHKKRLLSELGIDILLYLPFTLDFSKQTPSEFIANIRQSTPFTHLILGHDATIGKNRQGNKKIVEQLAKESGFTVEYLTPKYLEGTIISSSLIRNLVEQGLFKQAEQLLGRPYSILAPVASGSQKGRMMGYPTANLNVGHLTLPPYGVYAVYLRVGTRLIPGVANLGIAPTLRTSPEPIFETFLFENPSTELKGEIVELFPLRYLRPEIKFPSVEELKMQIQKDIQNAKACHQLSELEDCERYFPERSKLEE
jgi:riboflavin kinase / FMN adenylyltransferase